MEGKIPYPFPERNAASESVFLSVTAGEPFKGLSIGIRDALHSSFFIRSVPEEQPAD